VHLSSITPAEKKNAVSVDQNAAQVAAHVGEYLGRGLWNIPWFMTLKQSWFLQVYIVDANEGRLDTVILRNLIIPPDWYSLFDKLLSDLEYHKMGVITPKRPFFSTFLHGSSHRSQGRGWGQDQETGFYHAPPCNPKSKMILHYSCECCR